MCTSIKPLSVLTNQVKSIKMDSVDSITQFPTITSSLHAERVALSKQGPGMETVVRGSLR